MLLVELHRSLVALHAHLTGCRKALATATCEALSLSSCIGVLMHFTHILRTSFAAGGHLTQQPACFVLVCIGVLLHFTHIFFSDLTILLHWRVAGLMCVLSTFRTSENFSELLRSRTSWGCCCWLHNRWCCCWLHC